MLLTRYFVHEVVICSGVSSSYKQNNQWVTGSNGLAFPTQVAFYAKSLLLKKEQLIRGQVDGVSSCQLTTLP